MSVDLECGFGLGDNDVRPSENRIIRDGVTRNLEPKVMAVLLELARRAGETVSREDLMCTVWPRGFVTDGVLSRCISQLRIALGDDTRSPLYIATVPRRGYRLVAPLGERPNRELNGILVCPITNLAAHGGEEYLADGLTDLLIARLAAALDQRVVSRSTAMTLKGKNYDADWIKGRLHVKWMVEGSLFQLGDDLQIIVQLIDVETDAHFWANTWFRPAKDVMSLLNDVTRQVATQIRQRVEPLSGFERRPTGIPQELERRYLQGLHHLSRRIPSSLTTALACFDEVLEQQQDHAPAHAGSALAHVLLAHYGVTDICSAMERARTCAREALAIDPDNADALSHMGAILFFYDWDFDEALKFVEASLEIKPNYEISLLLVADIHLVKGHFDTSQALIDLAVNTDPLNVGLLMNAGDLLILQRRYREAVNSLDQALEIDPGMRPVHLRRALALALCEEPRAAQEAMDKSYRISGEDPIYVEYRALVESYTGDMAASRLSAARLQSMAENSERVSPWALARAWAASGDEQRAVEYLLQAFDQRSTSMPFLGTSPVFSQLRKLPEVQGVLQQLGLPGID